MHVHRLNIYVLVLAWAALSWSRSTLAQDATHSVDIANIQSCWDDPNGLPNSELATWSEAIQTASEQMFDGSLSKENSNRLQPPTVRAGSTNAPDRELSVSSQLPKRWEILQYGQLQIKVHVPFADGPDAIRFWVNGSPAHPALLRPEESPVVEIAADGSSTTTETYHWTCPPLGRITLQAEYRVGNQWSGLSTPLHLQIAPPITPRIVAAGTEQSGLAPIGTNAKIIDIQSTLMVQFANIPANATIIANAGEFGSMRGESLSNGCFRFPVESALATGRHRLTFHTIDEQACGLSSPDSEPLWVDLYNAQSQINYQYTSAHRRKAIIDHIDQQIRDDQIADAIKSILIVPTGQLPTEKVKPEPIRVPAPVSNKSGESDSSLPSPKNDSCSGEPKAGNDQSTTNNNFSMAHSQSRTQLVRHLSAHATPSSPAQPASAPVTMLTESWNRIEKQARSTAGELEQIETHQENARRAFLTNRVVSQVTFDAPAYFPVISFGPNSQEDARHGLVILEGMTLEATASGKLKLTFKYIPPTQPCTLRLQLQFRSEHGAPWKTLTVPPSELKQSASRECCHDQQSYSCEFDSPAIARNAGMIVEARRRGSANFGYGYTNLLDQRGY